MPRDRRRRFTGPVTMPIPHPHMAGIDIGATQIYVCVPLDAASDRPGLLPAIGTRAGGSFGETVRAGGLTLIAAGALITTGVAVATILIAYKYLGLPMSAVMGLLSGMQTQPACLAYAT